MQINDLSKRMSGFETEIMAASTRVIQSGWFVLGPEVKKFEQSFAEYLGAGYCVGLANGTDAIELALRAMGVEHGDLVATVANAGMYTTTALMAIGAVPFFMDVDLATNNTTLAQVQRATTAGVKAVVVTHLYGLAVPEIAQIAELCGRLGIPLLEDCAQAHGASLGGKKVGTFANAASFSFYPTKNLGALGDGGAVVTNSREIALTVTHLRQYGWTSKYKAEITGARNSRLDEIQAACLSVFLPHLDAANRRRREIAGQYSSTIKHPLVMVPGHQGEAYVAHLYVVRSRQRDGLRSHLKSLDIFADVHYPIPDYRQPVLARRFKDMAMANTDQLSSEILTLPCYPEMTCEQVEYVISAVNGWKP